ncbi:hypothetical protein PI124_g7529 [Phytophthora idaei]|nr:hypothetical protein PI126_g2109 [Phytophthora idaei]KAG3247780.1 hypothetical protein PI124_g7529 [Phytophthora idaei]
MGMALVWANILTPKTATDAPSTFLSEMETKELARHRRSLPLACTCTHMERLLRA